MQEIELINECKKYNPLAQKIIYKKYYSLFLRISIRYVSDTEDAKDIVQDAFLKIFSNINSFKSEGSFEGWMKRIVVNDTLTFVKKKSKNNTESISEFSDIESNINNFKEETEDDQEDIHPKFTEEELLAAIHSLPEIYKIVFNLICIEHYSHKEASALLNISEENSRIRLMKARQKLKKIVMAKMVKV
ncbi:MAG TPA: sigma-70 family RNA polymerase sigma factor [Cytophagaceae bacterium]|jgi:RNA polymerase sigma-70 factor (ECF subfamily)|nr:sigma-70 family RNA polymerase sigma factor [Cytophagaceae bacterium]